MEFSVAPLLIADPRIPKEAREALLALAFAPSERHAMDARDRAARVLMATYGLSCPEVKLLF